MTDLAQRVIGAIEAEPDGFNMARWSGVRFGAPTFAADAVDIHRSTPITCETPCCLAGHLVHLAHDSEVEDARNSAPTATTVELLALTLWRKAYGSGQLDALASLFLSPGIGEREALAEFKIIADKSRKGGSENGK